MARMRFPGRPGCRADRVGIPYSAEDVVDSADPTFQFIASLHSGLQEFKELCGESEDEEFCGFTEEDVRLSGKKLRAAIRSEQKLQGLRPGQSGVIKEEHHHHHHPHHHSSDHKSSEAEHHASSSTGLKSHRLEGIFGTAEAQDRIRPLSRDEIIRKALAAKELLASLKAKHKHALQGRVVQNKVGRPRKYPVQLSEPSKKPVEKIQKEAQVAPPVAPVEEKKVTTGKRAGREPPPQKLATKQVVFLKTEKRSTKTRLAEKLNLKWQGVKKKKKKDSKPESPPVKLAKERPKSVVRQLLQRAKQGGSRPLAKVKDVGQGNAADQPAPQRRTTHTFVLPKFSRSRRAIIPNKRFIEDDPIPSALLIKRPRAENSPPPPPPPPPMPTTCEVKLEKETTPAAPAPSKKAEKTKAPSTANPTSSRRVPKQPSSTACTPQGVGKRATKGSSKPELIAATPKSSQLETPQNVPGAALSTDQLHQLEMSPVVAVTPHKLDVAETASGSGSSDLLVTAETSLSTFRKGLLEQPLIREGKRQRVPSLKVRMIKRQSEESTVVPATECEDGDSSALKCEEGKQNGSKKEKFHLFPKALPSAPKTFNRAGPMKLQRRDKDGKESVLTKRSGQIMLRKAKLQLNRTALNRSKAALARSLKAQLKREAKQKGRKSQPQRHSPRPGVTSPLSISVLGSGGSHPFDSPNSQPSQPSPLLASQSPGSQVGFASPPKIISSLSPISLPSKKEPGEATADKPKDASERKSESGGPRIKHVCRRAAVVLPKPLATFPAPPEASMSPTLSALPSPEKEKLLQSHSASRAQQQDSSDEERATSSKRSSVVRPAGMKLGRKRRPMFDTKLGRLRKRKGRCQECSGCRAPNCGKCVYCLDSKKFGGKNVLKKACINRTCKRPIYTKRATQAFIQPKTKGGEGDEVDSSSQIRQGPSRLARPSLGYFAALGEPSHGEAVQDEGEEQTAGQKAESPEASPQERPRQRAGRPAPQDEEGKGGGANEGGLEIMSAVRMPRHVLTTHARRLLKRKEKAGVRIRLPAVVPQPQPLAALTRFWSVPPNTCSIVHTQLKENFDLDVAWGRGLALTLAGPTCMRAVCFLCGSAGRQKLLYCSICCEPFHWFCLEEEDRPLEGAGVENWCCRRCQFCHVCGLQSGLLQCDRCQDTYHPECLGPAYPKQPSHRNVWVCTKCVKCKSCGATTPGSGHNATWTYDFSLCFECGKLMDKGNFCPVCRKCYADDDWESKMVQCSLCESWVHARCEGLTDEMYQLFSYLPEDIQYRCRVCSPVDPPEWQTILQEELLNGLKAVLNGLTSFKCSSHLLVVDAAKEKERLQRAHSRKKAHMTPSHTEAVRSSPRAQKHLLNNTSEATAQGTNNPTSAEKSPDDCKVDLISLTPKWRESEDNTIDVTQSVTPSPAKHVGSPDEPSGCDPDLGSSGCGSQVKAAKMSEVGIFERFAQTYETVPGNRDSVRQTGAAELTPETKCYSPDKERKLCPEEQPGDSGCLQERSGAVGKTGVKGCSEEKQGTERCSEGTQDSLCCPEEKPDAKYCSGEKGGRLCCSEEGEDTRCSEGKQKTQRCFTDRKTECGRKGEKGCSVLQPAENSTCDSSLMQVDLALPSTEASTTLTAAVSLTQESSARQAAASSLQTAVPGVGQQLAAASSSQTAVPGLGRQLAAASSLQTVVPGTGQQLAAAASQPGVTVSSVTTTCVHQTTCQTDAASSETNTPSSSPEAAVTSSQTVTTASETTAVALLPAATHADSPPSQTSITSSSPQAAISSQLDIATSETMSATSSTGILDSNQTVRCPVSSTVKTPASISRNLFETFLAVSKNDSSLTGQPETDSSGKMPNTQRSECGEIPGGVRKQEPDTSTPSGCIVGKEGGADPVSQEDVSQEHVSGSGSTAASIPEGLSVKTDQDASPPSSGSSALNTPSVQGRNVVTAPGRADRHVSIADSSDGQSKALVAGSERQFPPDFNTVRLKLEGGRYSSVEEFNEDMVHIIQSALSDDEQFPTRKKHSNSVKSIFMKQMERVFPWFNVKSCHLWQHNRVLPQGMLPDAVVPPHEDHTYAQWLVREITMTSPKLSPFKCLVASPGGSTNNMEIQYTSEDLRQCVLCLEFGDDFPGEAGRLLYAGQDDWVHVNCAMWSAEVFEESDHTLQNVHVAMVRGRQMRCDRCHSQGATVGCCMRGCPANYHFLCARRELCVFKEDKTVYCFLHRDQSNTMIEEQRDFSVDRRVCVDMADIRCMKKSWARGLDAAFVNILFGSCTVENLGSLSPLSDCRGCLLPLDFRCSRVYWSTVDARQRTVYTCRIIEVRPMPSTPELTRQDIRVIHDETHPDYLPLTSLDLPSMGLSHLLPSSDGTLVSHSSLEKTSALHGASLTESSHPASMNRSSLMEADSSASSTVPTSSVQLKHHMREDGSELASCEPGPAAASKMRDTQQIGQHMTDERSCGSRPAATPGSSSLENPQSQLQSRAVERVAAASASAFDYSKLSPSTLKMLNISDPQNVRMTPSVTSSPTPPPRGPGEFGNLAGMVERLNRAAMRSRSNSSGDRHGKPTHPMRNERCRSVDRPTTSCVNPATFLRKRSASLSPVGFTARAASPFLPPQSCITSPPLAFSRSPSPSAAVAHVRKSPSVTPILEQLETELTEKDVRSVVSVSRKQRGQPGASLSGEAFVDLTEDAKKGPALSDVRKNDKTVTTDGSRKGNSEESAEDGDMVLAQHILETVPEEILERSEVKVLVVPDSVSEEEALQLAQEALLQSGDVDSEQTTPQAGEVSPEENSCASDKSVDLSPRDAAVHRVDMLDSGRREDLSDDECVIVGAELVGPASEGASVAEHLVSCSREIKQELLAEKESDKTPSDNSAVTHSQSQSAVNSTPSSSQTAPVLPSPASDPLPKESLECALSGSQSETSTSDLTRSRGPGKLQDMVSAVGKSQDSCTSTLKMAPRLETMPVYDKCGNLIGQRVCRPYVVETVKKTASAIHIRRHHSSLASRSKGLEASFTLPLPGVARDGAADKITACVPENPAGDVDSFHCKEAATSADDRQSEALVHDRICENVPDTPSSPSTLSESGGVEGGTSEREKTKNLAASDQTGDDLAECDNAEASTVLPTRMNASRSSTTGCIGITGSMAGLEEAADQGPQTRDRSVTPGDSLREGPGEVSQLCSKPSSSLVLPPHLDASKLHCCVKVCKLSLQDSPGNSSISLKDLCEQCNPHSCTATTHRGRNMLKSPCLEPRSLTRKGADKSQCTDSLAPPLEMDRGKESLDDDITESCRDPAEETAASSLSVGLLELKHDLSKGSAPSIEPDVDEIGLGPSATHRQECDSLMGPVGKKPLCNGCGAPYTKNRLLEKHSMVELALNPPPSVANNKVIAESLRTVECCVSLERLSNSGTGHYNSGADVASQGVGRSNHSSQNASTCPPLPHTQPPAGAAPVQQPVPPGAPPSSHQPLVALGQVSDHQPLSASGLISHAQQGLGGAVPAPSCVARTKPAPSSSHPFNRSFMDFLKLSNSQGGSPEPDGDGLLGNSGKQPASANSCSASQHTSSDSHSSRSQAAASQGVETSQQPAASSESGDATVDVGGAIKEEDKEEGEAESLPLHTEIALRIKAESLARSSPGESGPFKCPTCKRLYRTADSFHAHAQSCDFDLSTSDEDDEGEEDCGEDIAENVREGEKDAGETDEASQMGMRTSLRQSTLTQRKAMESSQQQLAQQAAEKVVALRSPPATRKPPSTPDETQHIDWRGRGRPKKTTLLTAETAQVSPTPISQKSAAAEPVKRGRGRPRKMTTLDPGDGEAAAPSQQLSPKQSMLGAVGLVSKDCLGAQSAGSSPTEDEGLIKNKSSISPSEPSQKSPALVEVSQKSPALVEVSQKSPALVEVSQKSPALVEFSQKFPAESELSKESPSAPGQLRTQSRRLSSSHSPSSVVRRMRLKKNSQELSDPGHDAKGENMQVEENDCESQGDVESLLMIAENKLYHDTSETTDDKSDLGEQLKTETSGGKCKQVETNLRKKRQEETFSTGQDPADLPPLQTEPAPVNSHLSQPPQDQAAKDSDNDSDVVCLDDDPVAPSVQPAVPKGDTGSRQLLRKVLDESLVHPYGMKFLPGAGSAPKAPGDAVCKAQAKNSSVAEKHRTTSPILSRLASSLPCSLIRTPLQVNVTGFKDKKVEITVKPPPPPGQSAQMHRHQTVPAVQSHPKQTVQFHPRQATESVITAPSGPLTVMTKSPGPLTVMTTSPEVLTIKPPVLTTQPPMAASSGAVTPGPSFSANDFPPESDKSQSSLLLSSSNVQADIDSDDLSFTDSEDEEMSMDTTPVLPTAPVSVPHMNLRVNINTPQPLAPKPECPKTPEQQQANQLLSVLDKLSPDQKVVLTQQLFKTGALNIEDHHASAAGSQASRLPQSQAFQPSAPVMVHVSQAPQQILATSSQLRIMNAGPGMRAGQLAFFSQPEVGQAQGLQPLLVPQQPQPGGAAVMVQARPNVVMRQPGISVRQVAPLRPRIAPVTSLPQPQAAFTPTPAALTALGSCPATSLGVPTSTSLGVHSSLSAHGTSPLGGQVSDRSSSSLGGHPSTSLLPPQVPPPTVFCPQPPAPLLSAYPPQPLGAPPAAQRLGYMGSFLVDPASSGTGTLDHNKAKLQLLSILQGAMSSSGASGTSPVQGAVPGLLTTVAGASGGAAVAPVPSHQSQAPRVIRVVLDKSFNSDTQTIAPRLAGGAGMVTGSAGQPYIRVVKVPSSGLPPAIAPAVPSFPSMLPPASANTQGSLAGASAIPPASQFLGGGLGPDNSKATFIVRKRPSSVALPSQGPPSKRVVSLGADSNGVVQGRMGDAYPLPSSLQGSPSALVTSSVSSSSGMVTQANQVNLSSTSMNHTGMVNKFGNGVHMSQEEANSTLVGFRTLLKTKLPGCRARKQNIAIVRKDGSGSSSTLSASLPGKKQGKAKVKVKAKAGSEGPVKKKSGRAPKGGPMSHPMVHLSHQAGAVLPQAEVEEEIRDTPLRNMQLLHPSQQPSTATRSWPKDMPRLAFEISSQDGFSCRADSMEEAWRQVTEKVQDARTAARMKQLSYGGLNGVQMFGVGHDAVVYLVEQLAGAQHCRDYRFRYQYYVPQEDEELSINPSGSARCTPFTTRNPVDVFSFLMSRHRHRPRKVAANSKEEEMEHKSSRRATSMELPMAMRFRKLQEHAKEAVGVYRSRIHGRGLFCKRNIDNGEMVIEYAGEIIRSLLTDKREKYYESKGIGCYMFRIDDCEVVDATMHGSAARFINHSCEPNCYSKVINVDGKKHIVIFASRAIKMGEELTYDYKFPIEDVKIPCSCGSRKCRKYLN